MGMSAYCAPASRYDDDEVEEFYTELQSLINQTAKQGILVVHGNWNAKLRENTCEYWRAVG